MAYVHRNPPLTDGEAAKLAAACRSLREKRVIWTLLDTGLPVNELASLRKQQMNVQSRCLYVGAVGELRAIPMTPRIAPLLDNWFSKNESFGLSARSVQRVIRDVASRSGIDGRVTAERLRRTFGFVTARSGMSPFELQRLLGHKHLASTAAYYERALGDAAPDWSEDI